MYLQIRDLPLAAGATKCWYGVSGGKWQLIQQNWEQFFGDLEPDWEYTDVTDTDTWVSGHRYEVKSRAWDKANNRETSSEVNGRR